LNITVEASILLYVLGIYMHAVIINM